MYRLCVFLKHSLSNHFVNIVGLQVWVQKVLCVFYLKIIFIVYFIVYGCNNFMFYCQMSNSYCLGSRLCLLAADVKLLNNILIYNKFDSSYHIVRRNKSVQKFLSLFLPYNASVVNFTSLSSPYKVSAVCKSNNRPYKVFVYQENVRYLARLRKLMINFFNSV